MEEIKLAENGKRTEVKKRTEKLVAFILLHYGDRSVTDACVQSILAMECQEQIRILIVDNEIEKAQEERAILKRNYECNPSVEVLQIHENGGFSYANNQGYRYAREHWKPEFILILNNDVLFPQKKFILKLQESYRAHPCHILAPDVIRQGTGEHQNPLDDRLRTAGEAAYTIRMNKTALRLFPVVYPLLYLQQKRAEQAERKKRTRQQSSFSAAWEDIVPFGACLIFTPLFICRETRAFEPETRFFYEEYLLALRCQRKQYRICYDPSMRVLHESGAATRKSFRSEKKRMRFRMERTAEACEIYLREMNRGEEGK